MNLKLLGTEKKTEEFGIRHSEKIVDGVNYNYYISDYKGQDLATQVGGFIEEQLKLNAQHRFGFIDCLIFVVDIFGPLEEGKNPPTKTFDPDRINYQLGEWSKTALDAVFGMHTTNSLRYVCLLINKIDLANNSDTNKKNIESAYAPLINELDGRCYHNVVDKFAGKDANGEDIMKKERYAKFELVIGSATEGTGLTKIEKQLEYFSRPLPRERIDKINEDEEI